MKITFITWYPSCRRSDALAANLGGASHLIHYMKFKQPLYAPLKYIAQTIATWWRLWKEKPEIVLVASPPVFAVLAVWLYCLTHSRCRYIVDAHTGVFDDRRWIWLLRLSRYLSRDAVATIVTNSHLQNKVHGWQAKAIVIGDVPVEFPEVEPLELGAGNHLAVINTFSQDEPLEEVLRAAEKLSDIHMHITGNLKHSRTHLPKSIPDNVRFTGWLSDQDYAALLKSVDVVICLTTHDHTMQRGAYEAMVLEKPLITSDWNVLRETFYRGTIHVDNTAEEIVSAVRQAMKNQTEMKKSMHCLNIERRVIFQNKLQILRESLT